MCGGPLSKHGRHRPDKSGRAENHHPNEPIRLAPANVAKGAKPEAADFEYELPLSAESSHRASPGETAQADPEPTFASSPTDRWVYRGAVIRTTRISSSRRLVELRLCLFQIGGVEALGEPAVNRGEQIARFGPPALFAP